MEKSLKLGSRRHLPGDLWIQILRLLPVKSLLVIRAVSKLLLSIIDDDNFASLHRRSFPGNLETPTLIRTHGDEGRKILYKVVPDSNGIGKLDPELNDCLHPILTNSLDGLVLFLYYNEPEWARLWNPSTAKFCSILLPDACYRRGRLRRAALAYDSSTQDYKVVLVSYSCPVMNRCLPSGVWVYGVKDRSWTTVSLESCGLSTTSAARLLYPFRTLFFEGALLWTEGHKNGVRMVGFDLPTHKFRYHTNLPLPQDKHVSLVTLDGGSLLGLCGLDADDHVSLWAATFDAEGSASWVRRCVITEYPVRMRDIFNMTYGHVDSKNAEFTWKYETFVQRRRAFMILSYNLRTHHCHQSEIDPSVFCHCADHPCAYVQSLIKV